MRVEQTHNIRSYRSIGGGFGQCMPALVLV
jgi:hypothetical protein